MYLKYLFKRSLHVYIGNTSSCRRQKNFFWEEKGLLEPQIRVPEVVAGSGGIVNSPPGQKGHQREIKADQTGHI